MEFIIITGLSGAGKSHALRALEDIGFYCVDNLPPALLTTFWDLCEKASDTRMKRVAVVVDIRTGEVFDDLFAELKKFHHDGKKYKILFLDDNYNADKTASETASCASSALPVTQQA